jgi:glycosyltransferase involved in cell wall biosynthesis
MKVLYISGREPIYMRNNLILKGLRLNGVEVVECTSCSNTYLQRYSESLIKFIKKYEKDVDLIFIGYLGQPIVPIIKSLTNKPILFDVFLSMWDTLCFDRKITSPNSIIGKTAYLMDKVSCNLSDHIILDTKTHCKYFSETFNIEKNKFSHVFVGADDSKFFPLNIARKNTEFRIFYWSTFHPLHGVEYIVKAAEILKDYEDIHFELAGRGMMHNKVKKMAENSKLKNITFTGWVPLDKFYDFVVNKIATSDICLGGHFSEVDKGKRVISEKTFQFLAMKKPVIVGDNPANKELLTHKENALFVEHANPEDLAEKILELKDDEKLKEKIAENGYKVFKENCTPDVIGVELVKIIEKII